LLKLIKTFVYNSSDFFGQGFFMLLIKGYCLHGRVYQHLYRMRSNYAGFLKYMPSIVDGNGNDGDLRFCGQLQGSFFEFSHNRTAASCTLRENKKRKTQIYVIYAL